MIDALTQLADSIGGIVKSAITCDWVGLATNIVGTVRDSIKIGLVAVGSAQDVLSSAIGGK